MIYMYKLIDIFTTVSHLRNAVKKCELDGVFFSSSLNDWCKTMARNGEFIDNVFLLGQGCLFGKSQKWPIVVIRHDIFTFLECGPIFVMNITFCHMFFLLPC